MFKILSNKVIAPLIHQMVVEAPRIAATHQPGQFVMVHHREGSERIPLSVADSDPQKGTLTLVIQAVGPATREIVGAEAGDAIQDIAGPLGRETELLRGAKIVCVGGGVGTAALYPMVKALAQGNNEVTTLLGGRSAVHIILKAELEKWSREVLVTTEDGSMGTKGFVTAELEKILQDETRRPQAVFAVGPLAMMEAVSRLTRPYTIKTIVSLNPIMVDGTGMCGGCRVTVGGQVKFACVEGPEFDGHLVDFKELAGRLNTYAEHECRLKGK